MRSKQNPDLAAACVYYWSTTGGPDWTVRKAGSTCQVPAGVNRRSAGNVVREVTSVW